MGIEEMVDLKKCPSNVMISAVYKSHCETLDKLGGKEIRIYKPAKNSQERSVSNLMMRT